MVTRDEYDYYGPAMDELGLSRPARDPRDDDVLGWAVLDSYGECCDSFMEHKVENAKARAEEAAQRFTRLFSERFGLTFRVVPLVASPPVPRDAMTGDARKELLHSWGYGSPAEHLINLVKREYVEMSKPERQPVYGPQAARMIALQIGERVLQRMIDDAMQREQAPTSRNATTPEDAHG